MGKIWLNNMVVKRYKNIRNILISKDLNINLL